MNVTRIYLLTIIELIPEAAEPVTVETEGQPVPESRPLDRPGLAKCRPEKAERRAS